MFKYKNIPTKFVEQAQELLNKYNSGECKARKTNKKKYLVISVGREYRLVNKGNYWELMTHQKYNKYIDKGC